MEFSAFEVLKSVLGAFFKETFYKDAVLKLRNAIRENAYYKDHWKEIIFLIINKKLKVGEPLYLINNVANLPLDENTDEEAYKWLTLMLINSLGTEDSMIVEY